MIMDGGIADAGEMDGVARPGFGRGPQPPVVSVRLCRRSRRARAGRLHVRRHEPRRGSEGLRAGARREIPIPAVDVSKIDPKYYRRTVRYDTNEAPGTIIVDPAIYVYRMKATETPPAMAPMSAASASVER